MTQSLEQDGGDLTQGSGKGRWGRVDGAERTPCVRTRGLRGPHIPDVVPLVGGGGFTDRSLGSVLYWGCMDSVLFYSILLLKPAPAAYRSSWARGRVGAAAVTYTTAAATPDP